MECIVMEGLINFLESKKLLSKVDFECICSPTFFNIMINDTFEQIEPNIGKLLFADDGALWVSGVILHIYGKLREWNSGQRVGDLYFL